MAVLTTSPMSLDVLNRGMLEALRDHGYEVTGITSPQPAKAIENVRQRGFHVVTAPLVREPRLGRDLWCLARLVALFLTRRFDVIHCSTPKAMLLGTLAARLTFHRRIITVFRGRAYENTAGFKRRCYVWLDRLVVWLSRVTVVVSPSLRKAMLADGIGKPGQLVVIGQGASQGVDWQRFAPGVIDAATIERFRHEHGLGDDPLLLFVGRVREDKGINELVTAFAAIAEQGTHWRLVVAGPDERVGRITDRVRQALTDHPRIHAIGPVDDPRVAYAASEVVVLPTYREGFPNVSLEASAMELPVITTDAVGAIDSVRHEETGLIVRTANINALREAMARLMNDGTLRARLGRAGREWVGRAFDPKRIRRGMIEVVEGLLPDRTA